MPSLNCPSCGQPLAADAPQGLCPACLLRAGIPSGTPAPDGATSRRFVPPTPAELAPHFPQLEILELIGQGGMGAVYRARQPSLDRVVALKILSPHLRHDPGFAERFTREARALARLSHPNIVAVHDFGRAGEFPFLVMEFVDGVTLRHLLGVGKIAPHEALAIVPRICEALQYAHDRGIVHRDIKPENILLDRTGAVKIADFGLAKLAGEAPDLTITGAREVMGTPHYMAPEQIERPLEVDHRADIYSVGVVFYQMLTGELPLGRFAPPSRKVQIDVRLDEIVLRALEKEPEQRYQQASALRTEVETVASGRPTQKTDPKPKRFSRANTGKAALALAGLAAMAALVWFFAVSVRAPANREPVFVQSWNVTYPEGKLLTAEHLHSPLDASLQHIRVHPLISAFSIPPGKSYFFTARIHLNLPPIRFRLNITHVAGGYRYTAAAEWENRDSDGRRRVKKVSTTSDYVAAGEPVVLNLFSTAASEANHGRNENNAVVFVFGTARGEALGAAATPTTQTSPPPALPRDPELDALESNPEILKIQIGVAERRIEQTRARYNAGVADGLELLEAEIQLATLRAKLAGDLVAFSEARLRLAERKFDLAKRNRSAGIATDDALRAAEAEMEIAKFRLASARAESRQPNPNDSVQPRMNTK